MVQTASSVCLPSHLSPAKPLAAWHVWINHQDKPHPWDCVFTYDVRWGRNREGQPTVNDYVLLGEIGRGSYGKVQLCERRVGKPPWRRFAMKIVSKPRLRRLSEYVNVPSGGMKKVTAEDKVRR